MKVNLRFHGREMAHKELGFQILKDVEKRLSDVASIEMPAKMERRTLFTIFAPGVAKALQKNSSGAKPVSARFRDGAYPQEVGRGGRKAF